MAFSRYQDAAIITGFPGLARRPPAHRVRRRPHFTDARALKTYAGSAPITRTSGKSLVVPHRKVSGDLAARPEGAMRGPIRR